MFDFNEFLQQVQFSTPFSMDFSKNNNRKPLSVEKVDIGGRLVQIPLFGKLNIGEKILLKAYAAERVKKATEIRMDLSRATYSAKKKLGLESITMAEYVVEGYNPSELYLTAQEKNPEKFLELLKAVENDDKVAISTLELEGVDVTKDLQKLIEEILLVGKIVAIKSTDEYYEWLMDYNEEIQRISRESQLIGDELHSNIIALTCFLYCRLKGTWSLMDTQYLEEEEFYQLFALYEKELGIEPEEEPDPEITPAEGDTLGEDSPS